jgi:methylthioribose-1-phosphate isomerase
MTGVVNGGRILSVMTCYKSGQSTNSETTNTSFRKTMQKCINQNQMSEPTAPNIPSGIESLKTSALQMISNLESQNSEMNDTLKRLLSGQTVDQGELMAVQGKMLNFQRQVMATSKIIESLVNTIRTTLQTQV